MINYRVDLESKAAAINEEEGGLASMFSKKMKKDLEEANNVEALNMMKNEKRLGDIEKMLLQGILCGVKK